MYDKRYFGIYILSSCLFIGIVFADFFSNATFYISGELSTPYINDNLNLKDNYKYSIGIRKIALFPYQSRSRYYKGDEAELSDNALFGAVNGWEYLFSASSVRNQGHEYLNQEYWLKWSNNNFITKVKYIDKGSRDLQFASFDNRYKLGLGSVNLSFGGVIFAHPIYGHPSINDYEGIWWDLAYEYGYTDYMVPENDLNQNGIIDDPYFVWIETDPYTEEGYWVQYFEGVSYYWEDADSNYVAGSDEEFYEYHYPHIVDMYNEDNKIKEWQAEASIVIGLDFYMGNDNYYSHIWINAFPYSVGLTDKAYKGSDVQYDIGVLVGTNINENIGVFLEGSKQSYYGREEHNLSLGVNYRF